MGYSTSYGVGEYVASEGHSAILPKRWRGDGSVRGAIFAHGAVSDELTYRTAHPELFDLARQGIPVLSCYLGGASTWGISTVDTRIGQAWAFFKARFGVKADKFHGIGASMGFASITNYARANPGDLASLTGILGVTDIDDIHDNNRGGSAAAIEAAYGGLAAWNTAEPSRNPFPNAASLAANAIPALMVSAELDATCLHSKAVTYAAAIGATLTTLAGATHAFPVPGLDKQALIDFIKAHA